MELIFARVVYKILYTWHLDLTFSNWALFTVYPTRIMYLHPSPSQVITSRAREGGPKEHRANLKLPRESHSVTYVPGPSTLSDLSLIVAQPPPSFLCCPRAPSHNPSSPTSVYLVLSLHLLPPSTPFWPYCTDPFFPDLLACSEAYEFGQLSTGLSWFR